VRIADSVTRELRELRPGPDGVVGMYVCGPTVYDEIHVGNARPFVVFGLMKRYLEWRGQPTLLVENITDVNDKIYAAALARGEPSADLARRMTAAYVEVTDRLGIGRPDVEPLASETIAEIVDLIAALVDAGHAYEAAGDVYFAVRSLDEYGRVSHQRLDALLEGARVEPGELKRDALDFALWKANKQGEDTWWGSPWGRGRPGWHIECSAMAERHLGAAFALHGGGRDLVFPHHENESAQSRAAGRAFAEVWAHNGMLNLSGDKMSKSAGNFDRLRDALDRCGAETFLMFLLRAHYASPVEYSDATLEQARASCERLRNAFRLESHPGDGGSALREALHAALDDDFNTPRALALLFEADLRDRSQRLVAAEMLDVLGLASLTEEATVPADVRALADERWAARGRRDFAAADRIREQLADRGWEVRDTASGTEVYPRA
jgi:cysteinyl-tRNA synthetase